MQCSTCRTKFEPQDVLKEEIKMATHLGDAILKSMIWLLLEDGRVSEDGVETIRRIFSKCVCEIPTAEVTSRINTIIYGIESGECLDVQSDLRPYAAHLDSDHRNTVIAIAISIADLEYDRNPNTALRCQKVITGIKEVLGVSSEDEYDPLKVNKNDEELVQDPTQDSTEQDDEINEVNDSINGVALCDANVNNIAPLENDENVGNHLPELVDLTADYICRLPVRMKIKEPPGYVRVVCGHPRDTCPRRDHIHKNRSCCDRQEAGWYFARRGIDGVMDGMMDRKMYSAELVQRLQKHSRLHAGPNHVVKPNKPPPQHQYETFFFSQNLSPQVNRPVQL